MFRHSRRLQEAVFAGGRAIKKRSGTKNWPRGGGGRDFWGPTIQTSGGSPFSRHGPPLDRWIGYASALQGHHLLFEPASRTVHESLGVPLPRHGCGGFWTSPFPWPPGAQARPPPASIIRAATARPSAHRGSERARKKKRRRPAVPRLEAGLQWPGPPPIRRETNRTKRGLRFPRSAHFLDESTRDIQSIPSYRPSPEVAHVDWMYHRRARKP